MFLALAIQIRAKVIKAVAAVFAETDVFRIDVVFSYRVTEFNTIMV